MLCVSAVKEELSLKEVNALQFKDASESLVKERLPFVFIHNNILL